MQIELGFGEIEKIDREIAAYGYLLFNLRYRKEKLQKVTLLRKHNTKGRLVSIITCYTADSQVENVHNLSIRLYDEEYIWFLNAVGNDFPDVDFEDLSDLADKVVMSDAGTD